MDANNQRFWLWAAEADFRRAGTAAHWDRDRRALTLASARPVGALATDRAAARALADGPASAIDPWDSFARVSADRSRITAGGIAPDEVEIFAAPAGAAIRDITTTPGGLLLAVVEAGGAREVVQIDRRDRFPPTTLRDAGFAPDRLAAGASGPVWALDRAVRRLAILEGEPLPALLAGTPHAPDIFRPRPEHPAPPRYLFPGLALPADREVLAISADAAGRALLLLWPGAGDAEVLLATAAGLGWPLRLAGVAAPFTLGWIGQDAFAVATAGAREAIPFRLPAPGEEPPDGSLRPDGARRPLVGWRDSRFATGPGAPCAYLSQAAGGAWRSRRLHALSLPQFATAARIEARGIDAGAHGFVWHRLYVEAVLPPGTSVRLHLAAADDPAVLAAAPLAPHDIQGAGGDAPQAAALPYASEIPFHPGLAGCEGARLFTVLIQGLIQGGGGTGNRALVGRHLRLAVELAGTGQAAPMVFAIRAWGPRFSYRDRYLPEVYRGSGGADVAGADFLDRFLGLFESLLTPLEDQVADAWRLTRPGAAPADALDWLASWIGLGLDAGLGEGQKRRLIREATALWRWRGTLTGLQRMLDVVTDDGVARGELVVVEHFRLRRTFATILGADLAPDTDPLTLGTAVSGNSVIGPTFFLGAPEQAEFFALFRPGLLDDPLTGADERGAAAIAVATLLEQYANRVTVLVHAEVPDDRFTLIRRTVERECPAHVEPRVLRARQPLILGLASLLSVDSYLRPRPPRPGLQEGTARFGQAFLTDTASLDPRIEGGSA